MKKKIILVLSIMAIAICVFALSVSATGDGLVNLINPDLLNKNHVTEKGVEYINNGDGTFTVNGVFNDSPNFGVINASKPLALKAGAYLFYSDFSGAKLLFRANEDSSISTVCDGRYKLLILEQDYNFNVVFIPYATGFVADNLIVRFGVYKVNTYEYGTELYDNVDVQNAYSQGVDTGYNSGFSQGSEEGYTNGFAEGSEFGYYNGFYAGGDVGYESGITQGKELGFTNGYAAGGDNYKLSTEYDIAIADAWNAGRSNGYKAGYKDKASEFNPLTLVIPLLTVCELALVITVIVKKIRRRKRT